MSSVAHGKFDRLFAEGRQALLSGTHALESAPADGVPRWGIGVVLRPDPAATQAIERVTRAAAGVVGRHHWLAGAARSSHLTLRAGLEPFRSAVPAWDPHVARYAAAMRAAVSGAGPLRFAVTGLTLTPRSVMACAAPADTAPIDLDQDFSAALSAEGYGQAGRAPDIWYVNLVYFTGPVRDAQALVEWVAERREATVTDVLVADVQLVRWRHTSTGMVPVVLASVTPPNRAAVQPRSPVSRQNTAGSIRTTITESRRKPAMTDQPSPAPADVEGTVARPGGVSYLRIPARDVAESAEFYRAVFGWRLRGDPGKPSFSDGTGHVIGHWRTDLPAVGQAGVLPYVYVTSIDGTLRVAAEHGAEVVTPPYPEGDLWVATIRDPAGNVIGMWQAGPR